MTPEQKTIQNSKTRGYQSASTMISQKDKKFAEDYFRKMAPAPSESKNISLGDYGFWTGFLNCILDGGGQHETKNFSNHNSTIVLQGVFS